VKIIKKRLYESEGLSSTVRWDETCECVQSFDGTTWVDNPIADPRYNPANLAPVNSETDPRCSAAFGMRNKIESIMQAFFEASALIDAANAILALITVTVPGVGLIWRVIFAVVEALYAIGSAALVIAFTEEAYDELQCIFYANIGEDGQMSATQLSDINTQICEDMDITICAAMGLLLNMLGWVGMSNAGSQFAEEGDCSYCPDEWCYTFDFSVGDGGWSGTTYAPLGATYSGGMWTSVVYTGGYFYCQIFLDFGSGNEASIQEVSFVGETIAPIDNTPGCTGWTVGIWQSGTETTQGFTTPASGSDQTLLRTGTWDNVGGLSLRMQCCPSGGLSGTANIKSFKVKGTGFNPFGESNCEY